MEENNIYCKFTYKCGICGKEFSSVLERAQCEIACTEKAEEEAKKAAEEKKKEEQRVRKDEVDAALRNLHKLVSAYAEDYGYYSYEEDDHKCDFHWPSRLWSHFWN